MFDNPEHRLTDDCCCFEWGKRDKRHHRREHLRQQNVETEVDEAQSECNARNQPPQWARIRFDSWQRNSGRGVINDHVGHKWPPFEESGSLSYISLLPLASIRVLPEDKNARRRRARRIARG